MKSSAFLAELVGTFLLVFFGCGAVHAAVLMGAQSGLWQVAIVWGLVIAITVFALGRFSGAHLNPAVSIALAVWGKFPTRQVGTYILAQVLGAFLAASALFQMYSPFLALEEKAPGVERGKPGSELTAMCYGEYYPAPGRMKALISADKKNLSQVHQEHFSLFGMGAAFFAEVIGTAILALVIFAVTDSKNNSEGVKAMAPVLIGLTVAILISVIAPLTQACFNPARDFGPRLFAWIAGWGSVAIPGPNGIGFLTVYIVAPIVGAIIGGGVYQKIFAPEDL